MMRHIAALAVALLSIAVVASASAGTTQCCSEPLYNYTSRQVPSGLEWYFIVAFGDNRPENTKQVKLPHTFYQILNETRTLKPYAVVGTGDHVGEGRENQYVELWKSLSSLENVLLVPGNHDLLISGSEERWERYVGPRYWCWRGIPGWGIVGVDTYDRLLPRFKKETSRVFNECGGRNIILVTHYPIEPNIGYNIDTAPSGGTKKKVLEALIEEYNVSIVLQGHWHGYAEKKLNNTLYVITGGAGAPFYNLRTDRSDADYYRVFLPHYLVIILNRDGSYKLLPVYLGKGSIIVEKPKPWEAHIYQDKFLLNGTPAELPVRVYLEREGVTAMVQLIVPFASWVNVTLHTNGTVSVSGDAGRMQVLSSSPASTAATHSTNTSSSPPESGGDRESAPLRVGSARNGASRPLGLETLLAISVIVMLVALKFLAGDKGGIS
ncbi:MAG: metallophosphoesterase [Desulfurococcales archaeon]|nr:metallophosphoesterase [Desulfurococcales archaeon]